MVFLILHVYGLFSASNWCLWDKKGLPFCPLELLMLLLKDGERPAKPLFSFLSRLQPRPLVMLLSVLLQYILGLSIHPLWLGSNWLYFINEMYQGFT